MIDLPGPRKQTREQALREAIELFYFAYRAFTAGPDQVLSAQGLGRVHHRILYFVGRNPQIAVHALLEILAVSKQALNAPMRQLVEGKLIVVRADDRDRRFKRLSLTSEGRKLEAHLTGTQMKLLAAAFEAAGGRREAAWKVVMQDLPSRAGTGP
jgi:DNA-binding MarR family transcriptional regulator